MICTCPPPGPEISHRSAERRLCAELRAENAARRKPRPLCRRCRFPIHPDDAGELFPNRCSSCDIRKLGELVHRAVRRRGRRRTIRALKRLAR
jgi:hypothetical protein